MTADQLCSMTGADASERRDIEAGLAAGLPPCCVVWYAWIWDRIACNYDQLVLDYPYHLTPREKIDCESHLRLCARIDLVRPSLGYTPCPACLVKALSKYPSSELAELPFLPEPCCLGPGEACLEKEERDEEFEEEEQEVELEEGER
jgi:hypothetical protein